MKRPNTYLWGILFVLGFLACKKEKEPNPDDILEVKEKITYEVSAPTGKLPWPQHAPTFSDREYELMQDKLFILNNFGQYQAGEAPHDTYIHAALDIMLANGTPIYAVDSGFVRANIGGNQFYRSLIVEDKNTAGEAWGYTHIYDFEVEVGDFVQQGQLLGKVNFHGLQHIHLSRFHRIDNGSWQRFDSFEEVQPDDFFFFEDTAPPVIETPFLFFEQFSNNQFKGDGLTKVNGKVDIVVGMRDVGAYANGTVPGNGGNYGNRLTVRKIRYKIKKGDEVIREKESFDFGALRVTPVANEADQAFMIFKYHGIFFPDGVPNGWDRFVSHYIITNVDEQHQVYLPENDEQYWDTAELDENGQAIFPNGTYTIEVTAIDAKGNERTSSDQVVVEN